MLHDRWQRHGKRPRQLAYRDAIAQLELSEQRATRGVGKRGKGAVESGVLILNHMVKYMARGLQVSTRHGADFAHWHR